MKKTNFTAVIVMLVVFGLLFAPLSPIIQSATAQNRQNSVVAKPGTPEYYNDDNIRYRAKNVRYPKNDPTQKVGGNPQVDRSKGEKVSEPLSDEEDVTVSQVLEESGKNTLYIETLSRDMQLYILNTPLTDINGDPVVVRRKKATKKIVMIVNCGNWAREVGAQYPRETIDNTCKNYDRPVITENRENGKLISKTYDFGCGNVETVPIEIEKEKCECIPGSYTPKIQKGFGQDNPMKSAVIGINEMKKNTSFKLGDAIKAGFGNDAQKVLTEMEAQYSGSSELMLKALYVEVDPCPVNGRNEVHFLAVSDDDQSETVKKKKWWKKGIFKWILFIALVGVVGIVILTNGGDLEKRTPIRPRIIPPDEE